MGRKRLASHDSDDRKPKSRIACIATITTINDFRAYKCVRSFEIEVKVVLSAFVKVSSGNRLSSLVVWKIKRPQCKDRRSLTDTVVDSVMVNAFTDCLHDLT